METRASKRAPFWRCFEGTWHTYPLHWECQGGKRRFRKVIGIWEQKKNEKMQVRGVIAECAGVVGDIGGVQN
jgi:hypothetical protein